MSLIRTRWAAIGAAVAVALGAGGIGLVSATQPDSAVAFVPITPCRVMDTRTEFNVGPKTSPLGPGETYTVNTTTGNTGDCTGIPTTATGVSLNITALDATQPTFLTIWATGEPQPEASSLNPVPGQPPAPNAVTTGINTNGQFDIYNLQGNVQVLADINGYYTDHNHDDRYYTKTQTDDRYFTKIQTDDRYAPRATHLNVSPLDFAASGLWSSDSEYVSRPAGANQCTIAPIDPPAGRSVSQVVLRYASFAGVVALDVELYRNDYSRASVAVQYLVNTDIFLAQYPTEFGGIARTIDVDTTATAVADDWYSLRLCTPGDVRIYDVSIVFD